MSEDIHKGDSVLVNHQEFEFLIKNAYKIKHPLFCAGTIGIGKSLTVKRVAKEQAKEMNLKYVEWVNLTKEKKIEIVNNPKGYFVLIDKRLSEFDPTDIKGLPFPDDDVVDWKGDLWLKFITHPDANAYVFFDELNLGSPATQKSFYKVINDHQVAEKKISDGVIILGAGNRDSDRCNVFEMPKALDNRFTHCTLKIPDVDAWIDWAFNHDIDTRIIAFLKQRPALLFDENFITKREKAFPTPRSWQMCSNNISKVDDKEDRKLELLIAQTVGEATSMEFISWLKHRRNIDLTKILDNPEKAKELNTADLKYAFVSLATEWYRGHQKIKDLNKIIKIANNLDAEFKILLIKFVKKADENDEIDFVEKFSKCKGYDDIVNSVSELLDEVN